MRQYDSANPLGPRTIRELEEEPRFLKSKRKISEFVTAITGRKEIPLKFEYLGVGAELYDRAINVPSYSGTFQEQVLLDDSAKHLNKLLWRQNANFIYVGCGSGLKAIPVLKEFGKLRNSLNYALLDISPTMLLKAYKNTRKHYRGSIIIRCFEWDFEEGNFAYVTDYLKKNGDPLNVIMFLGGTIGNLSDRARILANFRESMALDDYLLITFHMVPKKPESLLEAYSTDAATKWITTALSEIGINLTDGYVNQTYNHKKNQVEIHFVASKDVIGHYEDREIRLRKGQKVLLEISHKFSRSEIRSLLNVAGFKINWFHLNKGSTMANVLCQPKQF